MSATAFDLQGKTYAIRVPIAVASLILAVVDVLAVTISLFVCDLLYHADIIVDASTLDIATLGLSMGCGFALFCAMQKSYALRNLKARRKQVWIALSSWVFVFCLIGWMAFLTKTTASASRVSIVIYFVAGFPLVYIARTIAAGLLMQAVSSARVVLRSAFVIVMGDAAERARTLRDVASSGTAIAGIAEIGTDTGGGKTLSSRIHDAVAASSATLAVTRYDAVHIFMPWKETRAIAEMRGLLNQSPVAAFLFTDSFTDRIVHARRYDNGLHTGYEIQRAPLSLVERGMKRAIDVSIAAAVLLLLSPILLMVSIAVYVDSGAPILFRQRRKGFGGRPFAVLKFRTMTVVEDGETIQQAVRNDSRVTKLGAILRKTSVDELPQLINVLKGDMSLVGPRPHALAHDNKYDKLIATYAYRQHVKPGLTGWAQVKGYRGETKDVSAMAARVDHDLWYINNWSIWLDLRILVMTAIMLLRDKNAY